MSAATTLDLSPLSEDEQLSFFCALFAMSAADRDMDESEDDRIFESLDLTGLSKDTRQRLFQVAIQPPPLERSLLVFADKDEALRRGLMLNLIDVVLADGLIEPGEHVKLHEARDILKLSRDDVAELHDLAYASQGADVKRPIAPAS
ncbi:MAG: TerB family tellurite resistance protein [Bacteroidota bacterium]